MSLKLGGGFLGAVLLIWRLSFPMIVASAPSPGSVTASGSFKLNGVDFPATAAVPTAFNLTDRLSTGGAAAVITTAALVTHSSSCPAGQTCK
jgi:hypothetical protein